MLPVPLAAVLLIAADSNGWISLFDGKSVDGWLEVTGKPFPSQSWRIEDGCLRAFDPGNGFQDLRTKLLFEPAFEFQFEWKIAAKGNSGVKYFVNRVDDWTNAKGRQARARGLEYQLFDDAVDNDPRKLTGSLYDALAPSRNGLTKPIGEFNQSTIRVVGGRAEHWLNGVQVVTFDLGSVKVQPEQTFLSLQNHGSPVWFRNLKVRKIENGTGMTSPVQ